MGVMKAIVPADALSVQLVFRRLRPTKNPIAYTTSDIVAKLHHGPRVIRLWLDGCKGVHGFMLETLEPEVTDAHKSRMV